MRLTTALLVTALAAPGLAGETRELDAHVHGVSELDVAFDGRTVVMELHAPGADIVGFEHAAESAEDRAAVDAAVAVLARPLELFVLPAMAEYSVVKASAALEGGQADADHAGHGHDDDGHDHDKAAGHTEFHATYELDCANPVGITEISFAYFERFANAREVEVQVVTANGAAAFEITRDAPVLDLGRLPQS